MAYTPVLRKITLLALSLTASTAFAQMRGAAKQMRLWAGPKIGMNMSNFYTDSSNLYNKYKVGFLGGASVNFSFNSTLSFQTEINYSSKGGKFRSHTDTSSMRATYNLAYLDVPLLVQIKGGEGDGDMFFQLGAQGSFRLNANYSENKTNGTASSSFSNADIDSLGVPKSDLGLLAGFGMIGANGWCFTLRANIGMGSVPDLYNKIILHHLVFQASLGYYFGRKYDVIGGKKR